MARYIWLGAACPRNMRIVGMITDALTCPRMDRTNTEANSWTEQRGESRTFKGDNELQLVHKQNKIIIWLDLVKTMVRKADPGPVHRGNAPFWNSWICHWVLNMSMTLHAQFTYMYQYTLKYLFCFGVLFVVVGGGRGGGIGMCEWGFSLSWRCMRMSD